MTNPSLIVITGLPATGKTTISNALAEFFKFPVLSKDSLKEMMFDICGYHDRDWSQKIGSISFSLMYELIALMMEKHRVLIVETDFSRPDLAGHQLSQILARHKGRALEIKLFCESSILMDRFRSRSQTPGRHPGHCDVGNSSEFEALFKVGMRQSLNPQWETIEVNTDDIEKLSIEVLVKSVNKFLKSSAAI